jgi:hypothetical protein
LDKNISGNAKGKNQMRTISSIPSLYLLAAIVVLAPTAPHAASRAKHGHPKASHNIPIAPLAASQPAQPHYDADTWMMFPVSFAAIGFAIRRQRHALGSLQPLVSLNS